MLCGGLTVFAPMKNYGVKKGSKVAVIGIGGLGHFAIQFAKALGAEVTAFGHSPDKEADAKKMGAKDYVSCACWHARSSYADAHGFCRSSPRRDSPRTTPWSSSSSSPPSTMPPYAAFPLLLTLTSADPFPTSTQGLEMADLFSMLSLFGRFHSVGLPDAPLPQFQAQAMAGNAASLSVSHIGNKKQANEMLALAVEKGVTTWKQVLSMKDVGKGVESVKTNQVRYRHVLKQDILD